jgi:hypothetical protein
MICNDKIHLAHLTNNRNLDNFESSNKVQLNKPNYIFDKLISERYKK